MRTLFRQFLGGSPDKPLAKRGLPLRLDPAADSESDERPGFLAPPPSAPPYHGFPVFEDVTVDGFTLGLITDSFANQCMWGDAFVIAPDGRRAGLVWSVDGKAFFETYRPSEGQRFGVFGVGVQHRPCSPEEGRAFLCEVLPRVKAAWQGSAAD